MINHVISVLSALWVALNLVTGLIILLIILLVAWVVPSKTVTAISQRLTAKLYRCAVRVNSFWMKKVVGIEVEVKGELNAHPNPVVICNHQTWFDIPLVQEVITANGPMIKFLVKRELTWVPIIGWICLALDFPRLQRNGTKNKNGRSSDDLRLIQKASQNHSDVSGALLLFPEGTRFTNDKQTQQGSPYQHLLKPRSGGIKMIKRHVSADTPIVDITINYHQENVNIWRCLHGDPKKVTITIEHHLFSEVDDVNQWLNDQWFAKDALLSH